MLDGDRHHISSLRSPSGAHPIHGFTFGDSQALSRLCHFVLYRTKEWIGDRPRRPLPVRYRTKGRSSGLVQPVTRWKSARKQRRSPSSRCRKRARKPPAHRSDVRGPVSRRLGMWSGIAHERERPFRQAAFHRADGLVLYRTKGLPGHADREDWICSLEPGPGAEAPEAL